MKIYIFIFSIFLSVTLSAQTATEIIEKHFKLTGGEASWKALKTMTVEGSYYSQMYKMTLSTKSYAKAPNLSKSVVHGSDFYSEVIFDGSLAWESPIFRMIEGKELEKLKADSEFYSALLTYKGTSKIKKLKDIKLLGTPCFRLEYKSGAKNSIIYYIRKDNYYVLAEEQKTADGIELTKYKEFKKVNGLIFPHYYEIKTSEGDLASFRVKKIVLNSKLPKTTFAQ